MSQKGDVPPPDLNQSQPSLSSPTSRNYQGYFQSLSDATLRPKFRLGESSHSR